jgi:MmyB-like transcription regulator ligand binding domain
MLASRSTQPGPVHVPALRGPRRLRRLGDPDPRLRRPATRLAGTDPDAPDLAALVGELLLKSPEFAKLWERYDVTRRTAARTKTFHHPQVGTITLSFQGMQLENTPGHRLGVYVAEPGTPDHDAMILLDMTAPSQAEKPAAHQQR